LRIVIFDDLNRGIRRMPDKLPIRPDQPPAAPSWPAETTAPGKPPVGAAAPFQIAAGFSKKQLILAFAIAGLSDVLAAFAITVPPFVWAVDLVTAILLFIVLGWSWLLLPGLVMEAIPGWGVIPTWLFVVGAIAVWGTPRPKLK
jgi:hypothetical protein